MPDRLTCPTCGVVSKTEKDLPSGMQRRCPRCRTIYGIPADAESGAPVGLIIGVGVLVLLVVSTVAIAGVRMINWSEETEVVQAEVGIPAPQIEGEDIDGQRFKLSDYRGKVVMLNFWGHW
jgi:hypothetical protein